MRKYISVNYLPSSEKINYYGVIFCALLSVICIIATANNLLIIASLLTIIYAIYVSTKPANEILMFIALAIPNTRSMEAFGISGAILACTFFCIIRIIHTHKINRKILLVGLIYLSYSTQFIVRFNDLKIGIIMPL